MSSGAVAVLSSHPELDFARAPLLSVSTVSCYKAFLIKSRGYDVSVPSLALSDKEFVVIYNEKVMR